MQELSKVFKKCKQLQVGKRYLLQVWGGDNKVVDSCEGTLYSMDTFVSFMTSHGSKKTVEQLEVTRKTLERLVGDYFIGGKDIHEVYPLTNQSVAKGFHNNNIVSVTTYTEMG